MARRDARNDDADQVVFEIAARAEDALDVRAEHVEREHVEEDVRDAAVQERISDELPWLKAGDAGTEFGGHADRPQGKPCDQRVARDGLEQKYDDVREDKKTRDRRQVREHEVFHNIDNAHFRMNSSFMA